MQLFLWKNGTGESDFTDEVNIAMPNSSNAHSGGVVVLAETLEEAIELVKSYSAGVDIREAKYDYMDNDLKTVPVIIALDKKGVVLYCDGDC